ncbi:hypothetical protein ACWJJH_18660 [Endozoicomonadaceae bacterium StTr2]
MCLFKIKNITFILILFISWSVPAFSALIGVTIDDMIEMIINDFGIEHQDKCSLHTILNQHLVIIYKESIWSPYSIGYKEEGGRIGTWIPILHLIADSAELDYKRAPVCYGYDGFIYQMDLGQWNSGRNIFTKLDAPGLLLVRREGTEWYQFQNLCWIHDQVQSYASNCSVVIPDMQLQPVLVPVIVPVAVPYIPREFLQTYAPNQVSTCHEDVSPASEIRSRNRRFNIKLKTGNKRKCREVKASDYFKKNMPTFHRGPRSDVLVSPLLSEKDIKTESKYDGSLTEGIIVIKEADDRGKKGPLFYVDPASLDLCGSSDLSKVAEGDSDSEVVIEEKVESVSNVETEKTALITKPSPVFSYAPGCYQIPVGDEKNKQYSPYKAIAGGASREHFSGTKSAVGVAGVRTKSTHCRRRRSSQLPVQKGNGKRLPDLVKETLSCSTGRSTGVTGEEHDYEESAQDDQAEKPLDMKPLEVTEDKPVRKRSGLQCRVYGLSKVKDELVGFYNWHCYYLKCGLTDKLVLSRFRDFTERLSCFPKDGYEQELCYIKAVYNVVSIQSTRCLGSWKMSLLRDLIRESDQEFVNELSSSPIEAMTFLSAVNLTADPDFGTVTLFDEGTDDFTTIPVKKIYCAEGTATRGKKNIYSDETGKPYIWDFGEYKSCHARNLKAAIKSMSLTYELYQHILWLRNEKALGFLPNSLYMPSFNVRGHELQPFYREVIPGVDLGGDFFDLVHHLDYMLRDTAEYYRSCIRDDSLTYLVQQQWLGYSLQLVMARQLLDKDIIVLCNPKPSGGRFVEIKPGGLRTGRLPGLTSFDELMAENPETPRFEEIKGKVVLGSHEMLHYHRVYGSQALSSLLRSLK